MKPARMPSDWARCQSEFRGATADGFHGVARQPVQYRWWTVEPWLEPRSRATIRAFPVLLAWAAIRRRSAGQLWHPGGEHVAVYPVGAAPGSPPTLVFEVAPDAFTTPDGTGEGVLFGELAPNGVLALETPSGLVWPTYNPRVPYPGSPHL